MKEQILFYTKIIFLKRLPSSPEKAKNTLVYEPNHYADDKTYKSCQYRKLLDEDLHQLIFIDVEPKTVITFFDNNSNSSLYQLNIDERDIISITKHTVVHHIDTQMYYLYHLKSYIPFNNNDFKKMNVTRDQNNLLSILTANLNTQISYITNVLYPSKSLEIEIIIYKNELSEMPAKLSQHHLMTLLFTSNLYIPPDFNIGIKAASYGNLTLLT